MAGFEFEALGGFVEVKTLPRRRVSSRMRFTGLFNSK
jgi:hypothetical protein